MIELTGLTGLTGFSGGEPTISQFLAAHPGAIVTTYQDIGQICLGIGLICMGFGYLAACRHYGRI